jgi:hypothetical protein
MALKPWREVITPHPDVAGGRYQQAEFAADLAQVAQGKAEFEYQDASEFYARTYLTDGMTHLLTAAMERVSGKGGEPVVQLKTAFGGGKTHTLLALYHALNGKVGADRMTGMGKILKAAGLDELPPARVVVIVGEALNPTVPRIVNGVEVRTLWGDIAAQLGGAKAYGRIAEADKKGVSPGADDLVAIMTEAAPAVILMDELVAYMGNIYDVQGLPSGSFDSNIAFIQSLTEATKRSGTSLLVASLPFSKLELGSKGGEAALEAMERRFGRLEEIWKPVGPTEGFEIVRRRLFNPVKDVEARDEVCRAFARMYDENPPDFPQECREGQYLDRMKGAYPVHPELFDRLYNDWSSLEKFQRTRGVLRLMAAVIHQLWANDDRSLLMMPGTLPMYEPSVKNELLRYLPEGWDSVVDNDVDGVRSQPQAIDEGNPRLGALVAARRVARTVFLGSAPHVKQQAVRGIEDVRVRLGVTQPGESVAVFNDATSHLTASLTHLYSGNRRYWYDTRPNLRRTMEERADKFRDDEVEVELTRRLRSIRERGDFRGVHACASSGEVPDEQVVRLVILPPSASHRPNQPDSPAIARANDILNNRGTIPRTYGNMLLFAAADSEYVDDLMKETRQYLSWNSIAEEADVLNLDTHQRREATTGRQRSNEATDTRLKEAYCWMLVPTQVGTNPVQWEATRISGSQESPVTKASKKAKADGILITAFGPALLRMELDKWIWQDSSDVGVKRVWECFSRYLYLPRLQDESVFLAAVREGIRSRDFFGYASGVGEDGRYLGLQFGRASSSIFLDGQSVLVKPDVAVAQIQAESEKTTETGPGDYPQPKPDNGVKHIGEPRTGGTTLFPEEEKVTRFHGSVTLDATRMGRDAGNIAQEVVQHLSGIVGADVKITLEIQARVPDGVPDNVVRTVTENCRTLKFTTHGFEKE